MIKKIIDLDVNGSAFLDCFLQEGDDVPAVIICPGGAYLKLSEHEGSPIANRFFEEGFSAFVLHYSVGEKCRMPQPLLELAMAVIAVRESAKELHVVPNRVTICGFSAGGHLYALLASRYMLASELLGSEPEVIRPDAVILGYPMTTLLQPVMAVPVEIFVNKMGDVSPELCSAIVQREGNVLLDLNLTIGKNMIGCKSPTNQQKMEWSPLHHIHEAMPPVFIWTTRTDEIISYTQSEVFVEKLVASHVPVEFHLFSEGLHGLGLSGPAKAGDSDCSVWFPMAISWLDNIAKRSTLYI